MDLVEHTNHAFGKKTARTLTAMLDKLALPIPDAREYTRSWDGGYLVFINPAACVMRLTHQSKIPDVKDPHIQRPLGMVDVEDLRLDINPGMICPVDARDARALYRRFKQRGILLWDQKTHNIGYRPDPQSPDGKVPVLIDHASVQNLSDSVSAIRRAVQAKTWLVNEYLAHGLPAKDEPAIATDTDPYEELRQSFQESWVSTQPGAIEQFWRMANDAKKSGLLVTGWQTPEMRRSGYKGAFSGSSLYEKKWQGPT